MRSNILLNNDVSLDVSAVW